MKLALRSGDQPGSSVVRSSHDTTTVESSGSLDAPGSHVTERSDGARSFRASGSRITPPRGRGRRLKNLTMFSRQLAVLVRTGTPLAQSLDAIRRQVKPGPWRDVLDDLSRQIEGGSSLSEAMKHHPLCFDTVCHSLMAAGESAGELDSMLNRLADLTRQQLRIRRSIGGALIYPCLLATVGVVVVMVMIGFVLPRFAGLFETLDAPLPPTTQVLMAISDVLRSKWWMFLILAVTTAFAGKYWLSTPIGRRTLDTWLVRLPYLGHFVRSLITARIARLLGVLLSSQVQLLEALQLTRRATVNTRYADLMQRAEEGVANGSPLSASFEGTHLISPSMTEAVRHGEQSGQLAVVLTDMAEFMDEENEVVVRTLASIVEPLILIVLGVIVAFLAVSMFMPLFDLTSLTQGGA